MSHYSLSDSTLHVQHVFTCEIQRILVISSSSINGEKNDFHYMHRETEEVNDNTWITQWSIVKPPQKFQVFQLLPTSKFK